MIWGHLGPVFVFILVLVMGSSSCLAAQVPSSRRRPAVSRHRERLAGPGRGGRKPQQTRHGAWRSHGSPVRKGVLRPARWPDGEQTPTRCPSHYCAHCRVPATHFPKPLFPPVPRPLPQPIPLFSFPHPTNVSVHCSIPLLTPLCRHPPPHPTTRCSAHCLASIAQCHALLRNYWPSLLQLTAAPLCRPALPHPTDPPYSSSYSPIPKTPTFTATATVSTVGLPEVPLLLPHLSTPLTCSEPCRQWRTLSPAPVLSAPG